MNWLTSDTRSRTGHLAVLLLGLSLLAGCADSSDNRRFAGDQDSSSLPITSPTVGMDLPNVIPVASPEATPPPLADFAVGHGTREQVAVVAGGAVSIVVPQSGTVTKVATEASGLVIACETDASGKRFALLTAAGTTARSPATLQVFDMDGVQVLQVHNLGGSANGSPVAVSEGLGGLDWRPGHDAITVSVPSGGMQEIDLNGSLRPMINRAAAAAPGSVAWSADGKAVAFVEPSRPGAGAGVAVAPGGAFPLDPVWLVRPATTDRPVYQVDWIGGGALFLLGTSAAGVSGGDLLVAPAGGGAPRLFATANAFSSVAAITRFAVSPDGAVVAYVVQWPNGNEDDAPVVVLQQVGSDAREVYRLERGVWIDSLEWTESGVVIGGTAASNLAKFYLIGAGSRVKRFGEAPGTPSPVAASPIASPSPVNGRR